MNTAPWKRSLALLLALVCLIGALPSAEATELEPCLTLNEAIVLIGDSNTVILRSSCSSLKAVRMIARVGATVFECVRDTGNGPAYGSSYTMRQLIDNLSGSGFDTVIMNIGTNHVGGSMSAYRESYHQVLEKLFQKNPNAVIYLCLILPVNHSRASGKYRDNITNENIGKINEQVRSLYEEFLEQGRDVRLIDFNTPFQDSSGELAEQYTGSGGFHLTTEGYQLMNTILQGRLAADNVHSRHSWIEGAVLEPASCVAEGLAEDVCERCGATRTKPLPISDNHSWDSGTVLKPASCVESGEVRYSCVLCGETRQEVLPATGPHSWTLAGILSRPEGQKHGRASYLCSKCGAVKEAELCAAEIFTDAPARDHWAHEGVDWALMENITSGVDESHFAPKANCTRAQVVTFLWRLAGEPEPQSTANPFRDVERSAFCWKAVLWAVEQGITNGISADRFAPKKTCTRGEIVTFLWRYLGCPAAAADGSRFTDLRRGAFYVDAVHWANAQGVVKGMSKTAFAPNRVCSRAEVVTFLFRLSGLA